MSYLLQPLINKKLMLKNRLIMPPMATSKSDEDGGLCKDMLDYYDEKSRGGYISLIIIEHSYITQQGRRRHRQLSIADDSLVESLKELANIIHRNGSKVVMQMNHSGSATDKKVTGMETVGPSAIVNPSGQGDSLPRELNHQEIQVIVDEFTAAARRIKAAGFDGVEIHSAHGYLLNQFFSPLTNHRTDEYGGDVHSRIKIHLDVIKAVREEVGADFPILLRLGACDCMAGGTSIEDSQIAAQAFEKAGVDILDITGGFNGYVIPGVTGQGYFAPLSESIKKVVSIPVIVTGGIIEAQVAEKILGEGKADLIGVGRAIMNDSVWAERAIKSLQSDVK